MLQQSSEDLKRSFGTLVNVIDVRQAPRKRVAHSIGVFRARVIKAFFFFSPGFTLVILRKMLHALRGAGNFNSLREGHVLQLKTHSCTPEDTVLDII